MYECEVRDKEKSDFREGEKVKQTEYVSKRGRITKKPAHYKPADGRQS